MGGNYVNESRCDRVRREGTWEEMIVFDCASRFIVRTGAN